MAIESYEISKPPSTPLSKILETIRVEHSKQFPGGLIEVRKYSWSAPVEDIWTLDKDICTFNLALSPRPAPSRITHLNFGQARQPLDIGQIFILLPGSKVRVSAPTGQLHSVYCQIDTDKIESILQYKPDWDDQLLQETIRLHSHDIEWLMHRMYKEIYQNKFGSELVLESLANILCLELIRHFTPKQTGKSVTNRGGLAPWQMRIIRERAYAKEPAPCLTELANLCGITVRHLSREFKKETGQTIGKFVEAARIERAYSLLNETSLSIGEIASKLGFANSASFAYAFRRATGFRPSEVEGRCQKH